MTRSYRSALEPSPDSHQKRYLRTQAITLLTGLKNELGRGLNYFGLPSGRMLDILTWKALLDQVFAVERERDTATEMYRTAGELGIRSKFHAYEMDLVDITRLLALDDDSFKTSLGNLRPAEQKSVLAARATGFDVVNIDLCGGFLYSKNTNVEAIQQIISHQARRNTSFTLITTLEERDLGGKEYDRFIDETLTELQKMGLNTSEVRQYYLDPKSNGEARHLRRMRFCVPIFLLKLGNDHFRVSLESTATYKNFFHVVMRFVARTQKTYLGSLWPPVGEVRDILAVPLRRINSGESDKPQVEFVETPGLPESDDISNLEELG